MSYTNVYPTRINWENDPSINTPINETNLNKMDYALYQHDQTFANWDTTKANQSDLLLSVKSIDYDVETGVFVFTWQNGTTKTVDLNIEKIPVNFSMDANGVITMTTDDGTQYTADVGALIKTYTFTDSTEIDFSVTTDQSGNKTVTAVLKDGSIAGTKLQPNYLADCTAAKTAAETAQGLSEDSAEDAEAWAVGQRNGQDVPSTDPAYHNNSKYWAEHTTSSFAGLTDTSINNPQNGQVPVYNSTTQKWENADQSAGGGSTIVVSTSEAAMIGTTATITDGTTTFTATFASNGKATFTGVTITGNLTLTYTDGTSTGTQTISIPYFGNYAFTVSFFSATITVTYPASLGATCSITDGTTTINATGSPMAFTIPNAGTWRATAILDGVSKQGTAISITTDGQTETDTIAYGTITLTYDNDFRGLTISCVSGGTTISKTAPSGANTMVFYPPSTGTWTISGTVSGTTYSTTATVSSLSTSVSASLESLPNGSTVTPTDDIQTWLKCAGITDKTTYTTLADVLADTDTLIALCADSNASNYMARSTNWASGVADDSTAMLIVGKYNYCAGALLENSTWASAICGSSYADSVISALVPTMTSNTTPNGYTASASTYISGYEPYKVFDDNSSTNYRCDSATGDESHNYWLQIELPNAANVVKLAICLLSSSGSPQSTFRLKGSNNGTDFSDDITTGTVADDNTTRTFTFISGTAYKYYRLLMHSDTATDGHIISVQLYGRVDHGYTGTVIHSAVEDTTYYVEDGQSVPFCTIASGDTETVLASTIESLKNQTITLYSSVAKDPTNLSNDYSKQIRITPNITEIYLMPLGVFYWYGSEVENNEGKSIASNLTDLSQVAPTVTRNKNTMVITEPNGRGEVYWNKYAGLADAHVIYSATAQANPYTNAVVFSTTALPDLVQADWDNNYAIYMIDANESSIPLTHKNGTIKDRTYIKAWMANNSANAETVTLHALWLE